MKDSFSGYHPLVNFLFFAEVLGFSMFILHPVCLVLSLLGAAAYDVALNGRKALRLCLRGLLPMMLITALLNPAFNHQGATILTYLPSGNPLTLESILYGFAASAMLAGVVLWFACFTQVITADKFVYLFGRIIPSLSLVLSISLRFVPRFRTQLGVVVRAQRCIGRDPSSGSLIHRIRCAGEVLSVMITWALENGIDTADSMKSRGYGLPGRTAFSIYRLERRDRAALSLFGVLGLIILSGALLGGLSWRYYPTFRWSISSPLTLIILTAYAALCFAPFILNRLEDRKWKAIRSNI